MQNFRVALTHAGGIASEAILEKLPETSIDTDSLILLGERESVGKRLSYADSYIEVREQATFDFGDCAVVLMPEFDASVESRIVYSDAVLVSHCLENTNPAIFVASPDSEVQLSYTQKSVRLCGAELSCVLGVLPHLHHEFGIDRVNMVFMQSAEVKGKSAIDELASQTISLLNGREAASSVYPAQIAFNLIPTSNDNQLNRDLVQILGKSDIVCVHQRIDTAVFHGFVASLQLELEKNVELEQVKSLFREINAVSVKDTYSSPISDCNQSFSCVINRLQLSQNQSNIVHFWMIADSMRYGLANNYVNMTDFLLKSFL